MTDFERLRKEAEAEMELGEISANESTLMLRKEIAEEVKQQARKQAEGDIRQRRAGETGISQ